LDVPEKPLRDRPLKALAIRPRFDKMVATGTDITMSVVPGDELPGIVMPGESTETIASNWAGVTNPETATTGAVMLIGELTASEETAASASTDGLAKPTVTVNKLGPIAAPAEATGRGATATRVTPTGFAAPLMLVTGVGKAIVRASTPGKVLGATVIATASKLTTAATTVGAVPAWATVVGADNMISGETAEGDTSAPADA